VAKRVLIVDDEESTRLLLGRILEAIPGLESTLADSGEAALKLLAERPFDLIVLDLMMPGIGGIEALTRIRSSRANKKTPVIVVSVLADPDTKVVCRSMGVVEYIVKPIERQSFLRSVQAVLA
jgi:DNA-binding response OmpR family regulator